MFEAACAGGVAGATEVDTDLSEDEEDSDEDDRYMEIVFFYIFLYIPDLLYSPPFLRLWGLIEFFTNSNKVVYIRSCCLTSKEEFFQA